MAKPAAIDLRKVEALTALTEDERKRLLADIERAQQMHSLHIRKAMAESLNQLPWILRGPVKKFFS